jgi:catechol 2,3-dioxygenase-like lactoylglutathione lyase family enzyme
MGGFVKLHHVNVPTYDIAMMTAFYQNVFGMTRFIPELVPGTTRTSSVFLEGEVGQVHLSPPAPNLLFGTSRSVNPVLRGHMGFRVDDLEAIKARLRANNVPFDEYAEWAVKGWHQLYLYDPEGNVIEIQRASQQ